MFFAKNRIKHKRASQTGGKGCPVPANHLRKEIARNLVKIATEPDIHQQNTVILGQYRIWV